MKKRNMNNKGALDLLSIYNDDDFSEDEIVPGPKVSTKRRHKSETVEENSSKHVVSKFPIPAQLIVSKQEVVENERDEHQGRLRSFAHERGNWATFIYIPFSNNSDIHELIDVIKESTNAPLKEVDHFHISLTKTLVLKYHWIDSFVSSVSGKLKGMTRFIIMFDALEVYCNEERTRTFIGLKIRTGYDSLLRLTQSIDKSLIEYKLDTFYKDPSFHMSILWCLGDKMCELNALLPEINAQFHNLSSNSDPESWYINVDSIQCKSGNKYFTLSL